MAPESSARPAAVRTVTYDGATFMVNGARVFLLSGSVHYPRVHPSRWAELFATFREASINTLETYVFWGEHQPSSPRDFETDPFQDPQYDFGGRRDLFGFLQAAHDAGLYAVLRIGPYVCAEVSYGGFPFALREVADMRFRTLNASFQREVAKWVRFVCSELHTMKLMAREGGPVILVQLENEYQMVAGAYGDEGAKYLQWCSDLQHDVDLGVPAIMCYGAAEGAVETINSFYAHELVAELRQSHPNQPPVWTECWTGWYDVWGAPHHRRPTEDLCAAVARFCAVGGAGINYYMWLGGTNFGRTPMYLQATSYDYDAPIDEFYLATTKSFRLRELHRILMDHYIPLLFSRAEEAAVKSSVCPKPTTLATDVVVYTWGPELAFVCNDSRTNLAADIRLPESNLCIKSLCPRSVQIVNPVLALVLFDSAVIPEEHTVSRERRSVQHSPENLEWLEMDEPVLLNQQGSTAPDCLPRKIEVSDVPVEQLKLTKDCSDYCFYSATFEWSPEIVGERGLQHRSDAVCVSFEARDFAYVYVNGSPVSHSAEPLWEDRLNNRWNQDSSSPGFSHAIPWSFNQVSDKARKARQFTLTILVTSLGLVKGDWQLGDGPAANMLEEKKGLLSDVSVLAKSESSLSEKAAASRVSPWTAVGCLQGESMGWPSSGALGGEARIARLGEPTSKPTWYETTLVVPELSRSWVLDLGGMGKGLIWVNGHLLGRYWSISGTRPRNGFLKDAPVVQDAAGPPTQRYYHIPPWVVTEGTEVSLRITLFEERGVSPMTAGVCLLEVN